MACAQSPTATVPVGRHRPIREPSRRTNRAYAIRPYRRWRPLPATSEEHPMTLATIPGYPRIGKKRELKRALEGYWSGKRTAAELEETASAIRRANWDTQTVAGLDLVPV